MASKKGTYKEIEIFAPYTEMNKRDIALIGKKFGVNFSKTYTCYRGEEKHCGECGSCTERKEALDRFDNTIYIK